MDAECGAGGLEQVGHGYRQGMADLRAFECAGSDEVTEVVGLVIEPAVQEGLVQFDFAAIDIVDSGSDGIPPIGVEQDVAAGSREQGIALAEEIQSGIELGHAAFVFGLDEGQGIDAR